MKARYLTAVSLAVALAASACGGSSTKSNNAAPPNNTKPTCANGKLTVWLMSDAQTGWADAVKAANDTFAQKVPGCTADVQYQDWGTYQDKLTAAISGGTAPDVVEFGNSQTTKWIAGQALSEATAQKASFDNSGAWLSGLTQSCEYQGKLWCVPYYAGTRVVIYRTDMFKQAGIDAAPTTYTELLADADKLEAKFASKPNFSAFYVPGKYWYFGTSYAADAGGKDWKIATQDGGSWKAHYADAAKGLTAWQSLVKKYSKADPNGDEAKQDQAMAAGNIAMIYGNGWELGVVSGPKDKSGNPALAKSLAMFPMPSAANPDSQTQMPSFVGGSDLAVPAKSQNQAAAWTWLKAFAGQSAMGMIAKDGAVPNNTAQLADAKVDPAVKAAANATWFVPIAPSWSNVESSGTLQSMFSKIANGTDPAQAAQAADQSIASTLNTNG